MTLILPLDGYMQPSFVYDCDIEGCLHNAKVIQSKIERIPRDRQLCYCHFPQP